MGVTSAFLGVRVGWLGSQARFRIVVEGHKRRRKVVVSENARHKRERGELETCYSRIHT